MSLTTYDVNPLDNKNKFLENPYVLNKAAKKIGSTNDLIVQLQQLKLHGVRTPLISNNQKIRYRDIYLVPVFQQRVLGYFKAKKNQGKSWTNQSILQNKNSNTFVQLNKLVSNREEKRVINQAIRAVYALNLDYAVVKIGISTGAKPWVLHVNAKYDANDAISRLIDLAVQEFITDWDNIAKTWKKEVVIGADPEFILQDMDGKLVLASNFLPIKGLIGCDQIWTNRDRNQRPLAELRPIPADNVRDFIINLYKGMQIGSRKITNRNLKWLAGAMPMKGYPLGGHIHFSKVRLNSFLLRALDNYLTLPITLFEDKNGITRRPKYGFLGDYRKQFHGGFEYRTIPSWLVSPTITKGVIALSKLIAENYIYLYQNPLEDIFVQKAYYEGNKELLKPIVQELWKELKQLKDFHLYEKYLLPLERLLSQGYTWNEQIDFRKAWLIPPFHKG